MTQEHVFNDPNDVGSALDLYQVQSVGSRIGSD